MNLWDSDGEMEMEMGMEREREREKERERGRQKRNEKRALSSAIVLRLETECLLFEYEMARCSHFVYSNVHVSCVISSCELCLVLSILNPHPP